MMKSWYGFRQGGVLLAALTLVVVSGCGGDPPEAVFESAKTCLEKKDFKGFCSHLDSETQDAMASGMAMAGGMMKMMASLGAATGGDAPPEAAAALKAIDKVFTDHGITDEQLQSLGGGGLGGILGGQGAAKEAGKKLSGAIKDKPGFIGDMMAALSKMDEKGGSDPIGELSGKLADLKVDGDKATAQVVSTKDGKEKKEPIEFRKENGIWLIHMPMEK